MWICFLGAVLLAVLIYVSLEEEIPEEENLKRVEIPFYKMASWITGNVMKKTGQDAVRERHKLRLALMILCIGFMILPLLDHATKEKEVPLSDYTLERPEKGEGDTSYHIQAKQESEEMPVDLDVFMQERLLTDEEKETLFEQAREEIDKIILEEHSSYEEVRGHISLPAELQNGKITVYWIQDPQNMIDENGKITEDLPESGTIMILRALMNCEGTQETYEFALHLMPEIRNEEDEFLYQLRKAVEEAESGSKQQKEMELPRQISGRKLFFVIPEKNMTGLCVTVICLLALAGYFGIEQEYKKEDEERKRQLILDYPDLVFKLGMLLNAGLTIQNAFVKIAEGYNEHKREKKRYVYEEMLYACNEMKSGISEARAYENFGRRCGLTTYIRLGTTLAGGLQKSAEGITSLLLREAEEAMEDRRLLARKMGEEAGTKLLFPMILMLMVVMVVLMVPAMLSFG